MSQAGELDEVAVSRVVGAEEDEVVAFLLGVEFLQVVELHLLVAFPQVVFLQVAFAGGASLLGRKGLEGFGNNIVCTLRQWYIFLQSQMEQ